MDSLSIGRVSGAIGKVKSARGNPHRPQVDEPKVNHVTEPPCEAPAYQRANLPEDLPITAARTVAGKIAASQGALALRIAAKATAAK